MLKLNTNGAENRRLVSIIGDEFLELIDSEVDVWTVRHMSRVVCR